jgi:hypothetical protein
MRVAMIRNATAHVFSIAGPAGTVRTSQAFEQYLDAHRAGEQRWMDASKRRLRGLWSNRLGWSANKTNTSNHLVC